MRVAHVITRLIVGGAQENTIASVLGLASKPDVNVLLYSGPSQGPEGSLENVFAGNAELLSRVPQLVRPIHPWKDVLAYRQLTRSFRTFNPDIVHTHSGKAGILGRLAAAKAGVPVIIHSIHGPSFGVFQGALPNFIFRAAERRAARVTTHFVCVAEAMKQHYLRAGIGVPEMYTRVFSGFPLDSYLAAKNSPDLRAKFGLQADDIVVGKIARLFKLKGHDDLFAVAPELVRQCPRLRFLLVGDGEWRRRFENMARDLGLQKHFVFTGLVPPSSIPSLTGIMDFLIHLSTREGLARALPQALATGRPVISYDCDGAGEVCMDGETGFLVPVRDLSCLTSRILQLAQDPQLRQRLGERGRQFVLERFPVETMVETLHKLYLRLLQESAPRKPRSTSLL